jgi:hypothetical protein
LDTDISVEEFRSAAIAAGSAAEVAAIGQVDDMGSDGEPPAAGDIIEPITTRSGRQLCASTRYTGDWMESDIDFE